MQCLSLDHKGWKKYLKLIFVKILFLRFSGSVQNIHQKLTFFSMFQSFLLILQRCNSLDVPLPLLHQQSVMLHISLWIMIPSVSRIWTNWEPLKKIQAKKAGSEKNCDFYRNICVKIKQKLARNSNKRKLKLNLDFENCYFVPFGKQPPPPAFYPNPCD